MTTVFFYEKPGCINNTRQKKLLQDAGYEVVARDLLTELWTAERLALFFQGIPVSECFNRSAPQVKDGQVVPEQLSADEAVELMLDQPLLIRRPLMQVGEQYMAGFDVDRVNQAMGILWSESDKGELERCPRYITCL